MAPKDQTSIKEAFLSTNKQFAEHELGDDIKAVGKLEDIDLADNEIWLLQCPKSMNVKELESQKLKVPGRTNLSDCEAVAVEFVEDAKKHAFAYCNRKGRYDLRLLPVRGTIVLRNRLKAATSITAERIEECCPPAKRVPMPSCIRVRHPLLGHQFDDKLQLDTDIAKRLKEADKISAQILSEALAKKIQAKRQIQVNHTSATTPTEIESDNDRDETDAVMFVSEEVVKKKKSKRKHSESKANDDDDSKKKSKKICEDQVAKDLQWLQNL